ncbi:Quercetin 2,3-dioxygenase [compost metagenome]
MSAGTGVQHSEFNANADQTVKLLQIWLFPNKKNVTPRYGQMTIDMVKRHNNFQQILSPDPDDPGVWIHQDAWFSLGTFDENFEMDYQIKKQGNGVYAFIIKGSVTVDGHELSIRDGLGIWDTDKINLKFNTPDTEVLLMDIPMEI